jgi:anti-sigma B factor antagonist
MEMSTQAEGPLQLLSVVGDVDLESSPALRAELKKLSTARCPRLLIDFSKVTYIDSSGLATLIEYFQAAQSYQGKLGIAALAPRIKNSFAIVRLDEIFPIYADTATGLTAMSADG